MRHLRLAWLATLLAVAFAGGAHGAEYFQQFVHYTIDATLDTREKHLSGTESIRYVNRSPDTIDEFYLHLYPNAYRNRHTAFMKEYRRRYNLNLVDIPGKYHGWLDISDVAVDGTSVEVDVDDTIARFDLPRPLAPGDSITIDLAFDSRIRKHLGRAGYDGDHYDMAQWYPKVVVYDEEGFHPDKFSSTGEFYGEFGTFDVRLTVPADHVLAATGTVVDGDPGWRFNAPDGGTSPPGEGTRTVRFHADNVHDFAWCADPTFVVEETTVDGIEVRSFYRAKNRSSWADSSLAHAVRAIEWLSERVGPYPYPQVSIVDAAFKGGMEYPMLVMDGRADENLAVHEIGHIYFYGILANNERDEPWMDEAFTTFQTRWYQEVRYGPKGNRARLNWYERMTPQPGLWEAYRRVVFDMQRRGYSERVAQRSENFEHSYYYTTYYKGSLVLNAVRYALGEEGFARVLHDYYDRWKLKHVNEERFRNVVEEVTDMNLEYQFEQWLHTPQICDYELSEVVTQEVEDGVRVGVIIKRKGELFLPIEVVFELEDGTVSRHRIDGKLRTIREAFLLPSKPKRTSINPDNEIMDVDLSNNFSPRRHRFLIDWPNNNYYPEDGYTIRHRPGFWYNDVDGLKVGYHLDGSYHNWSRRIELGFYYGALSDRLDFTAAYDKPVSVLGRSARLHVSGYKMEGREDIDLGLRVTQKPKMSRPPKQEFLIGVNHHRLANSRYLTSTEIYDTNTVDFGFLFGYRVDPQVDLFSTNLAMNLRLGRGWFGGDYRYERFDVDVRAKTRTDYFPVQLRVRGFMGLMGGDTPTQQKFNLAGGGPLAQEQRFWLRSKGAVWPELNYHEPGDGNLRGYNEGTFGVNRLFAFNAELGSRLPLWVLDRITRPLVGDISWYGFYDAGRTLDDTNPIGTSQRVQDLVDGGILDATLQDAGIGVVAKPKWPFWHPHLRVDMPLWVNHPEVNTETDNTKFRFVFSLTSSF